MFKSFFLTKKTRNIYLQRRANFPSKEGEGLCEKKNIKKNQININKYEWINY